MTPETGSGATVSGAVLVTGIGELVTCAGPDGSTPTDDLAIAGGRPARHRPRRGGRRGTTGSSPGSGRPAPPLRPTVWSTSVGVRSCPGFVDSHSHLVYAGDRAAEFTARMAGVPYDGGGIGVSVAATRAATDDELRALLRARVAEMRALGTTTVEVKGGYGLTVDDEVRALRLAREVTDETTFLGAHVVPPEARGDRAAYLDLVCGPMLAACAPYARWVDVFCEPASAYAFTGDEARRVLTAGRDAGLGLRVHGNQLSAGPGVRLAVELGAASVDHCTFLTGDDVDALVGAAGTTVATLLPGVEFSTRSPYPDARHLARRRRRRRARDRLQPRDVQHGIHAVRRRARGARDADDRSGGPGGRHGRGRPGPAAHATSAGWRWVRGPTSPCSTRRRTSTSPTGPGCRSPAPSSSPDGSAAGTPVSRRA